MLGTGPRTHDGRHTVAGAAARIATLIAALLGATACTASAQIRGGAEAEASGGGEAEANGGGASASQPRSAPEEPAPATATAGGSGAAESGGSVAVSATASSSGGGSSSQVAASSAQTACAGDGSLKLTGQRIATTVKATGNCHVELVDCTLEGDPAIAASGNAHVEVTRGVVGHGGVAVVAAGNAHIEIKGAKVTGSFSKAGNAKIDQH